ncbi:unnamed protein product [Periconia digitata]|uniref:Replication protein A 32 kDa subunit n=1 Tax=Periconia digitata TaxID=1303443 RepID=A0A9W4U4G4_9PLEO|nr:unnamed protein product [Periconia digitata]
MARRWGCQISRRVGASSNIFNLPSSKASICKNSPHYIATFEMNYNAYESNTTYGAGGGGGGFMAEGSQNSPSGQQSGARQPERLRPLTIKQIMDGHQDAEGFKIDNNLVVTAAVVGQIRNVAVQTTHITYKIDDGTSTIEVKMWRDADAEEPNPNLVEGAYCRVWGKINNYNDKRNLISNMIRPVTDHNEIAWHLLNVTAVHAYYIRGPLNSKTGAGAGAGAGAEANQGLSNRAQEQPVGELAKFSATTRKVYQYLRKAPQSNEGLDVQDIAAGLGIDTGLVSDAGDELLEGGLIYTTVDDNTWAVLEEQ